MGKGDAIACRIDDLEVAEAPGTADGRALEMGALGEQFTVESVGAGDEDFAGADGLVPGCADDQPNGEGIAVHHTEVCCW